MKRIALLLVLVAACKSSDTAAPAAGDPAPPTNRAPSAARPVPALPTAPTTGDGSGAPATDRPALPNDRPHRRDRMARLDTDGDGKISDEERAAGMKVRAENMRQKLDANGDGKLTIDELANAEGRMKFADPATLDTNKDGEISADELAAGLQARREAWRKSAPPQ